MRHPKAFKAAFRYLISLEGKYSNDKNDKGEETIYGISRKYFPHWVGWTIYDLEGKKVLEQPDFIAKVADFYFSNFWEPLKLTEISQSLEGTAAFIFLNAVNQGSRIAARQLQIAITRQGVFISTDGVIGKKTISAINLLKEEYMAIGVSKLDLSTINSIALAAIARYFLIVTKNKSQRVYIIGWLSRTLKSSDFCINLIPKEEI